MVSTRSIQYFLSFVWTQHLLQSSQVRLRAETHLQIESLRSLNRVVCGWVCPEPLSLTKKWLRNHFCWSRRTFSFRLRPYFSVCALMFIRVQNKRFPYKIPWKENPSSGFTRILNASTFAANLFPALKFDQFRFLHMNLQSSFCFRSFRIETGFLSRSGKFFGLWQTSRQWITSRNNKLQV